MRLLLLSLSLFLILLFSFSLKVEAQSGTLLEIADIVNSMSSLREDVFHSLTFTLPPESQIVNSTDYINIYLDNYSEVTAATLVGGTFTGTPSYSVSGTRVMVTGITILPGKTVTIEGFTATNPVSDFSISVTISVNADGSGVKNARTFLPAENDGDVILTASVDNPSARLQISGYTAPQTYVTFVEGASVVGSDIAAGNGYFSKLFPAIEPGSHTYSFYGIDTDSRATSVITIDVTTPVFQLTEVEDMLLSPTLEINSTQITQGDDLIASGSAFPGSAITLMTDMPVRSYTASAAASGDWTYTVSDTSSYNPGDFRIYALTQTSGGLQSIFSPRLLFSVLSTSGGGSGTACGDISQGDLNCDDSVDLTDFSIMMYYWGTNNATADINGNSYVDLTDFSVMMYYWGT